MSIKITYLALDHEDRFPIISADSWDDLKLALDDYCGADERGIAKCLGFTPYNAKYGGDYEGYLEYECCTIGKDWTETYKVKIAIWVVKFYSETKIDRI